MTIGKQIIKMLPKEKEYKDSMFKSIDKGFNDCLADITAILEGVELDEDKIKGILKYLGANEEEGFIELSNTPLLKNGKEVEDGT